MFFKIGVLKNLTVFTETPVLESLLNKVVGPKACNFFKKKFQHRCFPVNFAKFLRTAFFIKHLRWLLLKHTSYFLQRSIITTRQLESY